MITDDLGAAMADPIKSYQTNPTNHDNAGQFLCYDIMGFFVTQLLADTVCLGWQDDRCETERIPIFTNIPEEHEGSF